MRQGGGGGHRAVVEAQAERSKANHAQLSKVTGQKVTKNLLWEFSNNENNVKQQILFRYFGKFLIIKRQRKLITLIGKNERSKQGEMN